MIIKILKGLFYVKFNNIFLILLTLTFASAIITSFLSISFKISEKIIQQQQNGGNYKIIVKGTACCNSCSCVFDFMDDLRIQ